MVMPGFPVQFATGPSKSLDMNTGVRNRHLKISKVRRHNLGDGLTFIMAVAMT